MTSIAMAIEAADQDPQDFYDGLSQTAQDSWDAVASYGWRPEHMELGFTATRVSDEFQIGPFESLSVLLSEVQTEAKVAGEEAFDLGSSTLDEEATEDDPLEDQSSKIEDQSEEVELEADSQGRTFLPTMAPIVDQQVADAAGKYHAIKTERVALTARETAARDELVAICHIKPELFKADPDNSNSKIYKVGDLVIRISNEVKEKITTEVEAD